MTLLELRFNMAAQLRLRIAPLRREDVALAVPWCASDGAGAECYRLLWENGHVAEPSMQEIAKYYAFGKHYAGAQQLDFAIAAAELSQPIGIASLTKLDWALHRAELNFLLIDPAWRGHGVGRRAVEMICDYAASQYDFRSVSITVLEQNEAAVRCFAAAGFGQTLRRANMMRAGDGQPHSRLLMVRNAKEPPFYDD